MDPVIGGLIAVVVIVLSILGLLYLQSRKSQGVQKLTMSCSKYRSTLNRIVPLFYVVPSSFDSPAGRPTAAPAAARGQAGPGPRRAQAARVRQRNRGQVAQHESDAESDEDGNDPMDRIELPDGKVGAKKMAKLQAKADRKAKLEAEQQEREERKLRQQSQDEERLKEREKEAEAEKKQEEEERKAREEQERKDHEEYLKMKAAFSVEEEGFEEGEGESETNLLQEFVKHIKDKKVVVLEDLASLFRLKTQNVIDRIQDLQNDGILTGVIDDRGKFIYISLEELESVAKFVKQRGRVSIADLAESSNKLINLNPTSRSEVCS
ncbi:DDRGK domain-containing protein 1 isoform X2 [Thrips palmi]|uniref:DDRGK domain-containing protein 1 n=1 Tax=Thrips palmi TaxID=161013 RepID=A0A6P8YDA1_THRPL|nr:DDRGK domain-containing protein 1 isoform X2 [Thrips palmi]